MWPFISAIWESSKIEGFAVVETDEEGRYLFKTIKPAAYPAAPGRMRPAHIHFEVYSFHSLTMTSASAPSMH